MGRGLKNRAKNPIYKRIILKLTGEALKEMGGEALNVDAADFIAKEIKSIVDLGVEVGVVIGGGNFIRGDELQKRGVEKVVADCMGMLATVINGLGLQHVLEKVSLTTRVLSALEVKEVAELYIRRRAIRHLEKKRVVIMAGGTGNPNFTTDTAAILRASEIGADAILKGTKVRGIFGSDPVENPGAKFIAKISYAEALRKRLKIIDSTAITLAMDKYPKPIHVFKIFEAGNLRRIIMGENIGSVIRA